MKSVPKRFLRRLNRWQRKLEITKMIKEDVSTAEFIVHIIDDTYLSYNQDELYDTYRLTKGYGTII